MEVFLKTNLSYFLMVLDILGFQKEGNKCVRLLGGWGKAQSIPMREGKE